MSFLARKFIRPSRLQSESDKLTDKTRNEKFQWMQRQIPSIRKIPLLSRLKVFGGEAAGNTAGKTT